jgi:peptidoglycan hydrolase CwlO-like protein
MIKKKMNNMGLENQQLNDEVRNAQENLRLSANQISKLNNELNDFRGRLEVGNQESETYRMKIHKLTS